jgi:hypothetical protein
MTGRVPEVVDEWVTRLTGLPAATIEAARERLDALGINHLSEELCRRPDVDAVAGACMLVSAFDVLVGRGVPETKLVAKLRHDPAVWPALAEIVAGRLVLPFFGEDLELKMDSGAIAFGPNADFRLSATGGGPGAAIEFKALGLSDLEASFFGNMATRLPDLVLGSGVTTYHLAFAESPPVNPPYGRKRKAIEGESRERRRRLPGHMRDAVVVGYLTEDAYRARLRARVEEALRQLDGEDDAWVAMWWSNGASLLELRDILSEIRLPDHVLGLMVIGAAVIVPDARIHYFHSLLPRPDLDDRDVLPVHSLEDDPTAASILAAFEPSVGLRPTLLLSPDGVPIVSRDGSRRIFPFNLLVGKGLPARLRSPRPMKRRRARARKQLFGDWRTFSGKRL